MSIGSVYETAYKGDFNQVKVKIDENSRLIETPDSVRIILNVYCEYSKRIEMMYNNHYRIIAF